MITNILHRYFSEAYVLMYKIPYKIIAAGYLNTNLDTKDYTNPSLFSIQEKSTDDQETDIDEELESEISLKLSRNL